MSEEATGETAALRPVLRDSAVRLKQLAVDGGFRVDEHTGDRMIRALEDTLDSLETRWDSLQKLGTSPPMSSTATANWVSGHMVNTATDGSGLLTRLLEARSEIPTYIEAIRLAKRNYRESDDKVETDLRAVQVPTD
ncbi:hypothetical protein [Amycolatopsis suaedae]|uniref:PE domain-containing protein n=1 Tax=Amycolatopsis suaedae TaxID=2510978 RepID=A0A4Q7J358_9PSEU|nr:hypothetical protein [Amycolatopsis suaedae]RZQ61921.1 hypothetical protein EWH70_20100 [Amycolatopsis suaedae]